MDDNVFVIPAKGKKVRQPGSFTLMNENGGSVPTTGKYGTFWRRRIKDGDVIIKKEEKKRSK